MLPAPIFIVLLLIASLGMGWWLVARLDREGVLTPFERLAPSILAGGIVHYLAIFLVGSFRLDRPSMSLLLAAALGAAIPGLRAMPWRQFASALSAEAAAARRSPLLAALWLAVLGVALSSMIQGMAPINDYDSLMYHLSLPQLDLERGVIAPAWDRAMPHALFPALMHHLYRMALALSDDSAAQMAGGLISLTGALAGAALARRMGGGTRLALLAALMFLGNRAVIWEMASPEVDAALAAAFTSALLVMFAWFRTPLTGLAVLTGAMLGASMLIKSHGMPLTAIVGVVMLGASWQGGRLDGGRVLQVVKCGLTTLALFAPHMAWLSHHTGNPLFPLFNGIFNPGMVRFFAGAESMYGTGRGLWDLLTGPWWLSVRPMQYFDGMVLGAPYFLALAPLAVLARPAPAGWRPLVTIAGLYYIVWFYLLTQQVRFLMPLYPLLGCFAAFGVAGLWKVAGNGIASRSLVVAVLGVLTLNQAMFVGIYGALRLPVAVGLMDPLVFHTRTPTMGGAAYAPCTYLRRHMQPGEQMLSLIWPHSFYCPQAAATLELFPDEEKLWLTNKILPRMPADEFIRRFREANFRYVIVTTRTEYRRNDSGVPVRAPLDLTAKRFGPLIAPAIQGLTPLIEDDFNAVFDGSQVLERLELLAHGGGWNPYGPGSTSSP